ncbi:MAG: TetR/AcrR family transcriptional regulator [Candidatus Thorarchaeota archaeon]
MLNSRKTESSSKSTRRERKAQKTREGILKAASALFREHSYENVKVEDISERADVSRATVYNYFESKEDIYYEIGIQGFKTMNERQKVVISSELSGLEKIIKLSKDALKFLFENSVIHEILRHYLITNLQAETPAHETLSKMLQGEKVKDRSDILRARYLQEIRKFQEIWVETINLGFEDGTIHHELNADQLSRFLFMVISGIFDRAQIEQMALERAELTEEHIIELAGDLIWKGISKN